MATGSGISWTDDTRNTIVGCDMDGPECANCYAIEQAARIVRMQPDSPAGKKYAGLTHVTQRAHGPFLDWTGEVRFDPKPLEQVRKLPRQDPPRRQFWCSMGDIFHDRVVSDPEFEGVLDQHLKVWMETPWLRHLVLTKRTWNMSRFFNSRFNGRALPAHIWPGTTVGTQKRADELLCPLGSISAHVLWLSIEPLLERLDLRQWLETTRRRYLPESGVYDLVDARNAGVDSQPYVDWLVIGGESKACDREPRPMKADWVRDLFEQADACGAAVWFKQTGEVWARELGLKSRHGSRMDEWPAWLQRQELPRLPPLRQFLEGS